MKKIGILLSSFLLLTTIIMTPSSVSAAANAIGVNPRRDYIVSPGDKISETLFVNNIDKTEELTVKVEIIDFQSQNETGSPALLLKATQPTKWSLKPFMTISSQYKIAAGKSVEVPFTISIPKNLGAGSYYSAVRYSAVNPDTGENVSLTSSAVTLLFVRVSGEARSSLTLDDFGAFTPNEDFTSGVFGKFYGASKPSYVSYKLRNNGNIAEQPTGSILIKDTFGKEYKLFQDANPGKNLVLIGQTRRIDVCLNEERKTIKNADTGVDMEDVKCNAPNLKPGRYTAQLGLVYGTNGNSSQELRETATFWYLPAWFIVSVLAGFAAVAFGVWTLIKKVKSFRKPTYGSRR
ncbi:MAG: hypothetical protein JWP13_979 [Candidatus Saccharibacteria bacterium]|nr:hypothetical protein [Candidatus Saccharibacteria bacterium]